MNKLFIIMIGILALISGFAWKWFMVDSEDTTDIAQETVSTAESSLEQDKDDSLSEPVAGNEKKEDVLEKEVDYSDEDKYSLAAMEEGLVVYYPFDDDILDYSGEDIEATNHNAYFVDGKDGKALKFNGTNSYVQALVDINPIPMPQMTMSAWVQEQGGAKIMHVVSSDDAGYDRSMGTDNRGPGEKGWACFAGDGHVLGSHSIDENTWTFIAAVYDQNAETVKLFVDGTSYDIDAKTAKGNDFILIGARGTTEKQGEYFKGLIDEVKIYDYALSNVELNSLYTTGVAKPVEE